MSKVLKQNVSRIVCRDTYIYQNLKHQWKDQFAWWQATKCPGRSSRNSGSSTEQFSWAMGQRGWKRQPVGGLRGLGTSPARVMRSRFLVGSGIGMADISAWVYGCAGLPNRSSREAISAILPRYITATRSEICSTTARLWATNRYVNPN